MSRYLEIKPGSISEVAKKLKEDYEAYFKKELEKEGKPITSMTDAEKKAFFNRVDKGWNAKNEQDDIQKAPNRHSVMKGKLLLEPKKDDMKDQPKMQQEATSSIISQDLEKSVEDEAVDKNHMLVVNPKNKKPGVDGVKKIHKSEWPKHQKQGYIQAEAVKDHKEPDADNMGGPSDHDADNKKKSSKEEELTAAQKKLPPALQKAIDKKEKNEEVELDEAGMKEIDTEKQEIERLRTRLTQLRDAEKASAGGDTTNLEKQINQTRLSLLDLQKRSLERKEKQEDVQSDKQNTSQKEKEGEKEIINKLKEGKMNYKSYKKSIKKEEDEPKKVSKGKTMTNKPLTQIDVEPKISHN
jgi:hypothetical protein